MSAGGEVSEAPPLRDVTVRDALAEGRLALPATLHAGSSGLDRPIQHPRVQKNGLALAGHFRGLVPTRVQVLGETELSYLEALSPAERAASCRAFFGLGLSVVVVTRGITPPRPLVAAAEASGTPLFVVHAATSRTINALHASLDELLAPSTQLHGVLVDVFGVGMLLLGKSGIGKSECALELVLRGHRLVADDVVHCDWRPPGTVFGAADEILRHHVEVRGLGILNVKDMFGVTAVRARKRIDVVVRLEEWSEQRDYDRLGVDDAHHEILSTPIRLLTVPVRPGREMGTILEMAARDELLRRAGTFSARTFLERLHAAKERAPEHSARRLVDGESISPPQVTPATHVTPGVPGRRLATEPHPFTRGAPDPAESSVFIPELLSKEEE
jgi:HPr kinase/phosphorylase